MHVQNTHACGVRILFAQRVYITQPSHLLNMCYTPHNFTYLYKRVSMERGSVTRSNRYPWLVLNMCMSSFLDLKKVHGEELEVQKISF